MDKKVRLTFLATLYMERCTFHNKNVRQRFRMLTGSVVCAIFLFSKSYTIAFLSKCQTILCVS